MSITRNNMLVFSVALMAAFTISTFFISARRALQVNQGLDRCQMICMKAEAEAHALKIQKKILERQVRMLKDLIPTNVTLKIELSDIIDSVDNEPCVGCIREGIIKAKDRK